MWAARRSGSAWRTATNSKVNRAVTADRRNAGLMWYQWRLWGVVSHFDGRGRAVEEFLLSPNHLLPQAVPYRSASASNAAPVFALLPLHPAESATQARGANRVVPFVAGGCPCARALDNDRDARHRRTLLARHLAGHRLRWASACAAGRRRPINNVSVVSWGVPVSDEPLCKRNRRRSFVIGRTRHRRSASPYGGICGRRVQ